jgi:hypothetical protein
MKGVYKDIKDAYVISADKMISENKSNNDNILNGLNEIDRNQEVSCDRHNFKSADFKDLKKSNVVNYKTRN